MRNDKNKTELFKMIFKTAVEEIPEIETTIITTMGSSVVTNYNLETFNIEPCNHEEADTRVSHFIHQ